MFKKNNNLVGLDIGSHSIKMVQVKETKTKPKLIRFGLAAVPEDAFVAEAITKPEHIAQCIKNLVGQLQIKDKAVAPSISGYEVMIKKIELPMMTEQELDNRMHVELSQYIPYNIGDVEVDYQIMDIAKNRPNHMDVLLVAAKKESVKDCIALVQKGGLVPRVIDVDFFALSNSYEATHGLTTGDSSLLILDIGAMKGTMNIICRGVPLFTRDIPIGGRQIDDKIAIECGVTSEEAELIKLRGTSDKISSGKLQNIFVGVVGNWVNEFKRTVDFYYRNYPENRIEKILLCGGSCRITGLDKVFTDNMGIEAEIFNPLAQLDHDSKAIDPAYVDYVGPQMAIALGLALRKTAEK